MSDPCPPHDWVDWSGKKRCRRCGTTMGPLRPAPPPPSDKDDDNHRSSGKT
ncbi:hypothetical protein [Yinghuangia sp. YIM S10712]|uniref:hypothetical protein n=1 Tax=Yinghuangia sp. YIM S10712 TaxID=3436930 RepID=UPI003F52D41F